MLGAGRVSALRTFWASGRVDRAAWSHRSRKEFMSLTNEDISAFRALLQEELRANESRVYEHIERVQGDIALLTFKIATLATRDELTDMETKLLTAFHEWASPVEKRMNSNRAVMREFDAAIESIQARLRKLEELNRPKQ